MVTNNETEENVVNENVNPLKKKNCYEKRFISLEQFASYNPTPLSHITNIIRTHLKKFHKDEQSSISLHKSKAYLKFPMTKYESNR